jgi:protein-disulfide isomerase
MKPVDQTKNILYAVIGLLLLAVIWLWSYIFMWKMHTSTPVKPVQSTGATVSTPSDLKITVISDKRCTTCPPIDKISEQVKQIPFLSQATFTGKDFADAGVSDFLKENKIDMLPAFILSTKDVGDAKFQEMLMPVSGGEFAVRPEASGANYDPFAKRSERGFLVIEKSLVDEVKADSYVNGAKDAAITWLEYSDLECPFCAKFHKSDVEAEVTKKYGTSMNKIFNHFPLPFHQNAKPAALVVECLAAQKWSDAFYSLIKKSFDAAKITSQNIETGESSSKDFLVKTAVTLWANKATLEKCMGDEKIAAKIDAQSQRGSKLFKVNGTPGSVFINNKTWEYIIISWAQPKEVFLSEIEALVK